MTYTWSAIWLNEMPDGLKAMGIACVLVALAVTIYDNMRKIEKPEEREESKNLIDDEKKPIIQNNDIAEK